MSSDRPLPWRLLVTPPADGSWNMAVDQALQEQFLVQRVPTFRCYGWQPACVSLGIAQPRADVKMDRCAALGLTVVRRPTGGRAILHDAELTYSLVADLADPLVAAPTIVGSYARINGALVAGLALLGVPAVLAPRPPGDAAKSAVCFDLAADYEITVGGRKLVGSAQSRKHGVVLQQGTLLLHADRARLVEVLHVPPTMTPDYLAERLVALDELLPTAPSLPAVVAALVAGLTSSWQVALVPGELTPAEHTRATELVATRYGHPAWTGRR